MLRVLVAQVILYQDKCTATTFFCHFQRMYRACQKITIQQWLPRSWLLIHEKETRVSVFLLSHRKQKISKTSRAFQIYILLFLFSMRAFPNEMILCASGFSVWLRCQQSMLHITLFSKQSTPERIQRAPQKNFSWNLKKTECLSLLLFIVA